MIHNQRVYMSDGWHEITDPDLDPDQARLDAWMDEIDVILRVRTGYGLGDYPDAYYNDWHKLGISPFWAACLVLCVAWDMYDIDCRALRRELGVDA